MEITRKSFITVAAAAVAVVAVLGSVLAYYIVRATLLGQIDGPVLLVGHSYGGLFACWMMVERPGAFDTGGAISRAMVSAAPPGGNGTTNFSGRFG